MIGTVGSQITKRQIMRWASKRKPSTTQQSNDREGKRWITGHTAVVSGGGVEQGGVYYVLVSSLLESTKRSQ